MSHLFWIVALILAGYGIAAVAGWAVRLMRTPSRLDLDLAEHGDSGEWARLTQEQAEDAQKWV